MPTHESKRNAIIGAGLGAVGTADVAAHLAKNIRGVKFFGMNKKQALQLAALSAGSGALGGGALGYLSGVNRDKKMEKKTKKILAGGAVAGAAGLAYLWLRKNPKAMQEIIEKTNLGPTLAKMKKAPMSKTEAALYKLKYNPRI